MAAPRGLVPHKPRCAAEKQNKTKRKKERKHVKYPPGKHNKVLLLQVNVTCRITYFMLNSIVTYSLESNY